MKVAELIEKLRGMNPDAEVRLEADFDGMTGSGDLAQVEYDDDGAVLLRDGTEGEPFIYRPAFTVEADGQEVRWSEIREVVSVETGRMVIPGERGPAQLVIDIDAAHFPGGETRAIKLTGPDGREFYATCEGKEVEIGVTRVVFPLPPFEEAAEPAESDK